MSELPKTIGSLSKLSWLNMYDNMLTSLPESIGHLSSLNKINLENNKLKILPENIGSLSNLNKINLGNNELEFLPESIGKLFSLNELNLTNNKLVSLPKILGNLNSSTYLFIDGNPFVYLPENISKFELLKSIRLTGDRLPQNLEYVVNLKYLYVDVLDKDLSLLHKIPSLQSFYFSHVRLSNRYWTKLSDWKAEWLLDEGNVEVRRVLIEQLGYEKICKELNADTVDNWREYTLLKIDDIDIVYSEDEFETFDEEPSKREPMVLLKMTCPSTGHIHILRVPPEITSAEAAITWVNHGIHPDKFSVQT